MVKKHACKAKLGEWSSLVGEWVGEWFIRQHFYVVTDKFVKIKAQVILV